MDSLITGLNAEEEDVDNSNITVATSLSLPDPCGLDLNGNGTNALCGSLWDLQGETLPELDHLPTVSSTPPSTASQQEGSSCLFSLAAPALHEQARRGSGHFTPTSIVRSYPPPSLRLPPQLDTFIPQSLLNDSSSSTLIEYYFKEVAALFSSYDSQMNPFRTTVSRLWGSSLAMCRTMQSMAAATLVHDFPQFGPMGLKMRNEAVEILTREATATLDDKSLLALLMLGQTASWHDPKDLGIPFFNLLRKHLNAMSCGQGAGPSSLSSNHSKNYQFFEEALVYWEMLLSFVTDNDSLSGNTTTPGVEDFIVLQRMPHPWTGIARDTHSVVQEVGRLVRRERARIRSQRFTSQEDILQAQRAIDHARQLEQRLLELAHPAEAEIISPGDDDTPVWHLLTMAEGYRCTGLIQLYRVFPDILQCRLSPQNTAATADDPFYSEPIISGSGLGDDSGNTTAKTVLGSNYDTWLTEFTLTTVSRLRTIPMESRTRCVQPFLFVASSSELRLPQMPDENHNPSPAYNLNEDNTFTSSDNNNDDDNNNDTCIRAVEVLRTRKFVLGRLTSYLHVLPPKPIHVCLQLVREVWRRMDEGQKNVYWMDVMIEKGWETTMG